MSGDQADRSSSIKSEEEEAKRLYAAVGELVLLASTLDSQLNSICILVLRLGDSPMLEPLVASLESARKVEILKAYATKITASDWKKGLKSHVEAVEAVNRVRNTAAHSLMSIEAGRAVLHGPGASKIFKAINLETRTVETTDIRKLEEAIRKGEAALSSGANLLENLKRVAAAGTKRKSAAN